MFPVQFDPEEVKREAQKSNARSVARLEKIIRGGFLKYMLQWVSGALVVTLIAAVMREIKNPLVGMIDFAVLTAVGILFWYSHKKSLTKLKADPAITYDKVVLPAGAGARLFWFAVIGFIAMMVIVYAMMVLR